MTSNYRQVEKELTTTTNSNIETTSESRLSVTKAGKLKVYPSEITHANPPDQPFNVVYQYACNQGECTTSQSTYIGHSRITINQ